MNKDAILATIIGFGIGLLITGAVLAGPSLVKSLPSFRMPNLGQKTDKAQISPLPEQQITQADTSDLTITQPENEALVQKNEITVAGETDSNATIVVSTEGTDIVILSDANGKFSTPMTLTEGKNTILITRFANAIPATASVVVYYTQEIL